MTTSTTGEFSSEEEAIVVAKANGWYVWKDGFGYAARMPNNDVVVLLKSVRDWKSVYTWVL
jgi:hypothetical protein